MSDDQDAELFARMVGPVTPLRPRASRVPAPLPKKTAPVALAEVRFVEVDLEGCAQPAVALSALGLEPGRLHALREGRIRPQATLDLHGFSATDGARAATQFIARVVAAGHVCALIIVGRGRRSMGEPVLREVVPPTLTQSESAPAVLAICSAHARDGGPGALYVLLRKRR